MPGGGKKRDSLPGIGGVYNSTSLNVFGYAGNSPIIYIDPDGKQQFLYVWLTGATDSGAGHIAMGVGSVKKQTFYEANPKPSGAYKPMAPTGITGSMNEVLSNANNKNLPDLILQINTSAEQDSTSNEFLQEFFTDNTMYNLITTNCADACIEGLAWAGINSDTGEFALNTPSGVVKALMGGNKQNGEVSVLEGNLSAVLNDSSASGVAKALPLKLGNTILNSIKGDPNAAYGRSISEAVGDGP